MPSRSNRTCGADTEKVRTLRVLLIEPYYGGSHREWADGYRRCSQHDVRLLTLPAQFWQWRMQGGAVTLARLYLEQDAQPDVILASDMFDLSTFCALIRRRAAHVPVALYLHENQLTYPQNTRQRFGWRYGFINYASALVADRVFFNSAFHRDAFFATLPKMLKHFPDHNELATVDALRDRSEVLPLGIDLHRYDAQRPTDTYAAAPPLIVWNHRWDPDKAPEAFFAALDELMRLDVSFRVALTGENVRMEPDEFEAARARLGDRLVQYGYMPDFAAYARLLWQADYVVSTAIQDFFGAAVAEAIYCGCVPLLPRRLNYPALVPADQHTACLYDESPLPLLLRHLRGEITVDRAALRDYIAQFDWAVMGPQYDAALTRLIPAR